MTGPMDLQERVSFSLRALYDRRGYSRYKMNKFEEYDLYARNRDFLGDHGAITFLDTNGRLMALKPDVTLSIVKNSRDDGTLRKLYYNENVYRVSKNTGTFRELPQMGLECLGPIDDYCICEVLSLAVASLRTISPDCVLDISHLGLLSGLVDAIGIPAGRKEELLKLIGGKNLHEMAALCRDCGIPDDAAGILKAAVSLSGPPEAVLPRLRALLEGFVDTAPLDRLMDITSALEDTAALRFDLSTVGDIRYYNGIVFKGFLRGLPGSILSGGQYDRLMENMGRRGGAIGFAIYMDALAPLEQQPDAYDVDTVLLYAEDTPLSVIQKAVRKLNREGRSVLAQRKKPEGIRCRQIISLGGDQPC